MRRLFIFVCLILLCPALTWACDICALHHNSNETGYFSKGIYAGFFEQFTHFDKIKSSTTTLDNDHGEFLDSSISQFYGGYHPNKWLGLQTTLPIIYRSFKRMEAGEVEKDKTGGLGDITLSFQVRPIHLKKNDWSFYASFLGGIKLPTGSTTYLKEEAHEEEDGPEGHVHGHDLTLGSGSIDGLVGIELFNRWKKFFIDSEIQYSLRTEGTINYRYANDLTWNIKPGYDIFKKHDYVFNMGFNTYGEHKKDDVVNGEREEGTGITSIFVGPDFGFKWQKRITASLGAKLPIFQQVSGIQLVPSYKITTTFNFNF